MRTTLLHTLALALLLASCAGSSPPPVGPAPTPRPTQVTLVALSDFHGALEGHRLTTASGETTTLGGAALIATYVEILRATAQGPVLLFDGGDLFQGTLVSNSRQGLPVVTFYNHLGMHAAALGNHEFDFGPESPERTIALLPEDDPHGALRVLLREATFPLLAANVFLTGTEERPDWVQPSVLLDIDGFLVGVVGAATPSTAETTIPANVRMLDFPDPAPWVAREAAALRAAGAELVVLVAHMGAGCRDFSDPDDLSSCRDHELFALLNALPPGTLDAAIGGHTHQGVAHRVNGVPTLQPFSNGRFLGVAHLDLASGTSQLLPPQRLCAHVLPPDAPGAGDCDPRQVEAHEGPLTPATFLGRPVRPDPATEALLAPDLQRVAALRDQALGVHVAEEFPRQYREESAMGNWVADMMHTLLPEVDVALTNAGGVRQNLMPGPLTYGALFEVLPFDNRLVTAEVSGAELRRIVTHGISGQRSALLFSNLSLRAEGCDVVELLVGGQPVRDDQTYRILLNDYLGTGGSGFDTLGLDLDSFETRWDLPTVRDMIADALRAQGGELRPLDYFDPSTPRQARTGTCAP